MQQFGRCFLCLFWKLAFYCFMLLFVVMIKAVLCFAITVFKISGHD
jgi:hypothetical protein